MIPDDVVERAWREYLSAQSTREMGQWKSAMRAALQVAVEWERNKCAKEILNATEGVEWQHPVKARQQLADRIYARSRAKSIGDTDG